MLLFFSRWSPMFVILYCFYYIMLGCVETCMQLKCTFETRRISLEKKHACPMKFDYIRNLIMFLPTWYVWSMLNMIIYCAIFWDQINGYFSQESGVSHNYSKEQLRKWLGIMTTLIILIILIILDNVNVIYTTQKMKFVIKDFFSKCDQIRRKLRICSDLLQNSLMENFIFCAVFVVNSCFSYL